MILNRIKRFPGLAASAALLAGAAAGCGATAGSSSTGAPVSYAPAAYGVSSGHGFDCYYIESAAEVTALINAHHCPPGSTATPMPLTWEETYWSYYDSDAYYGTYMPAYERTMFVTSYSVTFARKYSTTIKLDASKGTYLSSSGKKVSGPSVAKLKFTAGAGKSGSVTTVHGGGSLRGAKACSLPMTVLSDKSGSGSSSSHGGGSLRSGTSGSKTSTGSKSKTTGTGAHGSC